MEILERLEMAGTKFEFTAIRNGVVSVITKEQALNIKDANIYYLSGVDSLLEYKIGTRAKDVDILKKNMFVLDLDIRSNYKEAYGEDISNEEIIDSALSVIEELDSDEYFSEWSYVLFTGNGIHIYYIGDEQFISVEDYSLGVSRIFKRFDELIGGVFKCDHMCKNIARILRLPGSINQKNGELVRIIKEQNKTSRLVGLLKDLAERERSELRIKNLEKQKEVEKMLSKFSDKDNDLYIKINKEIPARQIAMLLYPQFPFDGRKNFKNEKRGYTGYFYNEDDNTIVNGGSRFFNWGDVTSGWDNFQMIKRTKNFTNKETFDFFRKLLKLN